MVAIRSRSRGGIASPLVGKVAVVTGAGSGIGRALAVELSLHSLHAVHSDGFGAATVGEVGTYDELKKGRRSGDARADSPLVKTVLSWDGRLDKPSGPVKPSGSAMVESGTSVLEPSLLAASDDNPFYWPLKGWRGSDPQTWYMRGVYMYHAPNPDTMEIEVDWCSSS